MDKPPANDLFNNIVHTVSAARDKGRPGPGSDAENSCRRQKSGGHEILQQGLEYQ